MPTYRALWNGIVIAESDATIVVDGYRYFPAASVQDDHLVATSHHSVCGWKGQASYYDVTAGTEPNRNAAWYYPDPKPAAHMVDGYIGFWKGIRIEEAPTTGLTGARPSEIGQA
jgi:uncharacterized protein (DUF427 family)